MKNINNDDAKSFGYINYLICFFVGILIVSLLGFYKTYLVKFPDFEGFGNAHHAHGALALSWILLLIAQPILLRAKCIDWHKRLGKISYIIMPLLLLSLFFVSKAGYERNIKILPESAAIGGLANGIPDIIYMGLLYTLAIYYKYNTAFHLRFMSGTGLMNLGPGLGRLLVVYCGVSPQYAIPIVISFTTLIGIVWLVSDISAKKSVLPMSVFVLTGILATIINANAQSDLWQNCGKWLVIHFFKIE